MMEFKEPRKYSGTGEIRKAKQKLQREPKIDGPEDMRRSSQKRNRRVFDKIVFRMHKLSSHDPETRNRAMEFLQLMGEDAVPTLSLMLNDNDVAERAAKRMLGMPKSPLSTQMDKTNEFNPDEVSSKAADIRSASALLLGEIGFRVNSQVKERIATDLLCSLKDPDPEIKYRVTSAFCRLGDSAHRGLQPLISISRDKKEQLRLRHKAIECICKLRIMGKPAINIFIGMTKDTKENYSIRLISVRALGELGKYAEGKVQKSDVFGTLIDRFDEQNQDLRLAASYSLVELEDNCISELFEVLNNQFRSTQVKLNVVGTLFGICKSKESSTESILSKLRLMRDIDNDPQNSKKMDKELRLKIDAVITAIISRDY